LVTAVRHAALGPVLVIVGVLGGLPLVLMITLIITLALVAVYSPHRTRRGAAERILDRLLSVLTRPPRR
jgi:cell division protein FtsL